MLSHKKEHSGFLGKHLKKLEDERKAKLKERYLKSVKASKPQTEDDLIDEKLEQDGKDKKKGLMARFKEKLEVEDQKKQEQLTK